MAAQERHRRILIKKKTQYSRDAPIAEAMILITLKQRNAILGICHCQTYRDSLYILSTDAIIAARLFEAHTPNLPEHGMIGPHLAAFLAEIKTQFCRVAREKLSDFLQNLTGETFTQTAIKDCITRTASQLRPKYCELRTDLQKRNFCTAMRHDGQ